MKKLMIKVDMNKLKYETIYDNGLIVYTAKTKIVFLSDNVEYFIIVTKSGETITIMPDEAVREGYILMKYPGKDNTIMLTESEYDLVFIDSNSEVVTSNINL